MSSSLAKGIHLFQNIGMLKNIFSKEKEYPYNYNEKHKIHLCDREINTIRTVIVATLPGIKWIQHGVFLRKQFAPLEFCSSVSR